MTSDRAGATSVDGSGVSASGCCRCNSASAANLRFSAMDDLLSGCLVGVPGTGGVAILLYAIDRHTFGSGLLERGQPGNFSVEYGYTLAYEHVAQLLAIGAGLGRHHGE